MRVVQHPHGVLVAVAIDGTLALDVLHPDEKTAAAELSEVRRTTFVAGRFALRRALAEVGGPMHPVLSDELGAPLLPPGFVGSISHKHDRAIALAARDEGHRGVDIELVRPLHARLAEKILTREELGRIGGDLEFATLASFSVKESIYKAIAPTLRRYVGFHEAILELPPREVIRSGFAEVSVRMELAHGETIGAIEATVTERDGEIVSTARLVTGSVSDRLPTGSK